MIEEDVKIFLDSIFDKAEAIRIQAQAVTQHAMVTFIIPLS